MTTEQLASISRTTFSIALFAYIAGMIGYFYFLAFRKEQAWLVGRSFAFAGLAAHVVSVATRGMAAHRVPWGNMYEYSSLLSLLVVAFYLFVIEPKYRVRSIGGFVLGFAVLTMAVSVLGHFYVGPEPLVPALQSYWIKIHVVAAITGSSLFALGGGVFTILYLVQDSRERRAAAGGPPPIQGGAGPVPGQVSLEDPPGYEVDADEPVGSSRANGLLPPAEVLDRLAYRTIAFAFPIWTFAVIAGAIWAEQAWGRYWGWDPKETWSFITWVIYAGYLHARATAGWRGRRAAVIALVGFASLLVTYYVVNLWIVGLHSYKGF